MFEWDTTICWFHGYHGRDRRGGRTPPPFHRQNIGKQNYFVDKICTKLQENASKISKVPRGHAFRPPRGAHLRWAHCQFITHTPRPPFSKILDPRLIFVILLCLLSLGNRRPTRGWYSPHCLTSSACLAVYSRHTLKGSDNSDLPFGSSDGCWFIRIDPHVTETTDPCQSRFRSHQAV